MPYGFCKRFDLPLFTGVNFSIIVFLYIEFTFIPVASCPYRSRKEQRNNDRHAGFLSLAVGLAFVSFRCRIAGKRGVAFLRWSLELC